MSDYANSFCSLRHYFTKSLMLLGGNWSALKSWIDLTLFNIVLN
jgi:hypothetical protein